VNVRLNPTSLVECRIQSVAWNPAHFVIVRGGSPGRRGSVVMAQAAPWRCSAQSTGTPAPARAAAAHNYENEPDSMLRHWIALQRARLVRRTFTMTARGHSGNSSATAGFSVSLSIRLGPLCVVEGGWHPSHCPPYDAVAGVTRVAVPAYAMHPRPAAPETQSNSTTSVQGIVSPARAAGGQPPEVRSQREFVTQTGANGTVPKFGVQSVGISSLQVIQGRGEIPAVRL